MNAAAFAPLVDTALDPLSRYIACKGMARGYAESYKTERYRLNLARAFCAQIICSYWDELGSRQNTSIKVKPVPASIPLTSITIDAQYVAENTGKLIASFPVEDAGYLIGSIYTVMLPSSLRSKLGAFYTPPPLVARLLDMAEAAGFDFTHGSAIDPACGGGAFLAPVALRMWKHSKDASPEWMLRSLVRRLKGIEIDPFAAWMSLSLLEAAVMPLCVAAKRRLPADMIIVGDALEPRNIGNFDLVIGNPPYGRVTLSESMRKCYERSLFGHANLYGLFTDLALRLAKPNGVVAYLTPTSFLGGQYFKALRRLVAADTTPAAFDFVSDREGVFDDVLQETLLTSYRVGKIPQRAAVSLLVPKGLNAAKIERIGHISIPAHGEPWLLPRTQADMQFLNFIQHMPTRLSDLGYLVSTGQLVWNRFKSQLCTKLTANCLPLIWAESVSPEGFKFTADRRNHVPYFELHNNQPHLVTSKSCVLVQRTTSREQDRRLLAAVLPQKLLDQFGGAVIENHLNMVYSNDLVAHVSVKTIEILLNTQSVDRAFRCISGSVAVSAYELNSLPLPNIEQMIQLEKLINKCASKSTIERKVAEFYGALKQ